MSVAQTVTYDYDLMKLEVHIFNKFTVATVTILHKEKARNRS